MNDHLTAAIAAAKCYPPIEDVAAISLDGDCEIGTLDVEMAEGRIVIAHDFTDALPLTPAQALALEERLAQARADVDAALDSEPPLLTEAFGDGSACEVCCQPIAAGSRVANWDDDGRHVVAHADRCPTPGRCRLTYENGSGDRKMLTPTVSEGEALGLSVLLWQLGARNVRLVRVKEPRRG